MQKELFEKALNHLRKDKRLTKHMRKKHARPPSRRPGDPFASLVKSIIYQQLSGKAAGAILKKFLALFSNTKSPAPEQVLKLSDAKLRTAGISNQKATYLKDLARHFIDGTIEPKLFKKMSDEEIRKHLIVVKGIGRWTADMFLIFTLYRPDVLPTGDLGIQKGFQKVFDLKKLPSPRQMEKLAQPWTPYRSVASLYLWHIADGESSDW
jgi:DNA-3-methyladenine glycosylase II